MSCNFMSCIFKSCIFMPCNLVRHFHVRHFQRPLQTTRSSTASHQVWGRPFSHPAPAVWNCLPRDARDARSLTINTNWNRTFYLLLFIYYIKWQVIWRQYSSPPPHHNIVTVAPHYTSLFRGLVFHFVLCHVNHTRLWWWRYWWRNRTVRSTHKTKK